jgi:hypothetical protein
MPFQTLHLATTRSLKAAPVFMVLHCQMIKKTADQHELTPTVPGYEIDSSKKSHLVRVQETATAFPRIPDASHPGIPVRPGLKAAARSTQAVELNFETQTLFGCQEAKQSCGLLQGLLVLRGAARSQLPVWGHCASQRVIVTNRGLGELELNLRMSAPPACSRRYCCSNTLM